MSKISSTIRTAFIGGVALLQIILLPASQLLHIHCSHPHDQSDQHLHQPFAACSSIQRPEPAQSCCHHVHPPQSDEPCSDHNDHVPSGHDEHDCPLCQVVLAARLGNLHVVQVPFCELQSACVAPTISVVDVFPTYRLLSRGPPA